MRPTVEGVVLTLRAERFVLSLPELERRAQSRAGTVRPPRVTPPELEGRFTLRPMRLFALRELLHIARDGKAVARIPLVPTTLKKGPFSIEIPDETALVIDIRVEDAHILFDREHTRGVVEPAIRLPLGLSFRGVNIKDDGSVVADVSKLPIDIAWIRFRRLRIPASLDEIAAMLKARDDAPADDDDNDEGGLPLNYSAMTVQARDVVPREQVFTLGEAGTVELGKGTELDVDYSPDSLFVRGHLAARGDISGSGFIVKGAQVDGRASAELRRPKGHTKGTAVEVGCEKIIADEAAVTLLDGSLFELRDVAFEDLHIWVRRLAGKLDWRFSAKRVAATLHSGMLMVWIGGRAHELHFGETQVEGAISLSSDGHVIDLEIDGAVVTLRALHLDLGAADLQFGEMHARASGHLRVTSDDGADFTGVLSAQAELVEGWLWAGPLRAHLLEGTGASLNVSRLSAGRGGLRALTGTGTMELQLASGSIPIGRTAELGFSRGATGTVAIHQLNVAPGQRWPHVEAGVSLSASSDPLELGGVTLPPGQTHVEIARIEVDPGGELSLGEIEISMESEPAAAEPADEELETTVDLPDSAPSYESVEVEQ